MIRAPKIRGFSGLAFFFLSFNGDFQRGASAGVAFAFGHAARRDGNAHVLFCQQYDSVAGSGNGAEEPVSTAEESGECVIF